MLTTPLFIQRSGSAAVVVMQTAKYGEGDDLPSLWSLLGWRHGDSLANALMRPGVIEESRVLPHHVVQMAFVEDENMVETLAM